MWIRSCKADEYLIKVSFGCWYTSSMFDEFLIEAFILQSASLVKIRASIFKWPKKQFLDFNLLATCTLKPFLSRHGWKPIKILPKQYVYLSILSNVPKDLPRLLLFFFNKPKKKKSLFKMKTMSERLAKMPASNFKQKSQKKRQEFILLHSYALFPVSLPCGYFDIYIFFLYVLYWAYLLFEVSVCANLTSDMKK